MFFSFVLDAFSRRVVGWQFSTSMRPISSSTRCGSRSLAARPAPTSSSFTTTATQGRRADSTGRRNDSIDGSCDGSEEKGDGRIGRVGRRCAPPGVHWSAGWSIVSGSGGRSRAGCAAWTPRLRRVCRWRLASGGFGRVAGCRRSPWPRRRGGTCRSPSARRSMFCAPAAPACGRSRVSSAGRRRRSPESCVATPRPAAVAWSTGPRPRSGTPTCGRGAPSPPSSP